MKNQQLYEARAKVAKALAHPSRLMMLDLLGKSEMSVTEITEAVGADQSTVSKHLAILKETGLIAARKEGSTLNSVRVRKPHVPGEPIQSGIRGNIRSSRDDAAA